MGMVLSAVGACLLFILKVAGILLLIILVLAALLLLCPFCADVCWQNDTLTVKAGALGITFSSVPIPKAGTSRPAGGAQGLYRQAENKIPRMACGAQVQKG